MGLSLLLYKDVYMLCQLWHSRHQIKKKQEQLLKNCLTNGLNDNNLSQYFIFTQSFPLIIHERVFSTSVPLLQIMMSLSTPFRKLMIDISPSRMVSFQAFIWIHPNLENNRYSTILSILSNFTGILFQGQVKSWAQSSISAWLEARFQNRLNGLNFCTMGNSKLNGWNQSNHTNGNNDFYGFPCRIRLYTLKVYFCQLQFLKFSYMTNLQMKYFQSLSLILEEDMADSQKTSHTPQNDRFQNQIQHLKQRQLVDQNYANGTFFMAMSTIEEIEGLYLNILRQKEFGRYDKCNYSWKDYNQLKNQLKTQLFLVQMSIRQFDRTYEGGFNFPINYSIDRVLGRLDNFIQNFKDPEMIAMCQDLAKVALKQFDNLKSKDMNFDQEKDKNSHCRPQEFIKSSNMMNQQRDQFLQRGQNEPMFQTNPKFQSQNEKSENSRS